MPTATIAALLAAVGLLLPTFALSASDPSPIVVQDQDSGVVVVAANPAAGFNFPYLLKLPRKGISGAASALIIETNNSGILSDDLGVHMESARDSLSRGFGGPIARSLDAVFLMPVFPRPWSDPLVYTHALDRDSMLIRSGALKRLDLQLVAMLDDALIRLRAAGYKLEDRAIMLGFSASGSFANRFALLHPDRLLAVVVGGINGIAMVPQRAVAGVRLEFPLGTADFKQLTGKAFDQPAWRGVPQLLFMGATDTNDAVAYDDAYPPNQRSRVRKAFGAEMLPTRWQAVQRAYADAGAKARFLTFDHIGHGTDGIVHKAVVDFLRNASGLHEPSSSE